MIFAAESSILNDVENRMVTTILFFSAEYFGGSREKWKGERKTQIFE